MQIPFDTITETYDQWYDSPKGCTIFNAELNCLKRICPKCYGRWLEVGVGTGRFACSLGISEGIDPSYSMLETAALRGIKTYAGQAEELPFVDGSFDGILIVMTFCFIENSQLAMKECMRVLRNGGHLLLGDVPADSPWGRKYMEKAFMGHPIYASARFKTSSEILESAQAAGFAIINSASTLLWNPGEIPPAEPQIKTGIVSEARFIALLFRKTASERSSNE